jgi:hypothetical protein
MHWNTIFLQLNKYSRNEKCFLVWSLIIVNHFGEHSILFKAFIVSNTDAHGLYNGLKFLSWLLIIPFGNPFTFSISVELAGFPITSSFIDEDLGIRSYS